MDQRASEQFPGRPLIPAILWAILACSACHAAGPYKTFAPEGKEYACEIPSDWEIWRLDGIWLNINSPDKVETSHAHIWIYPSSDSTIESEKERYEARRKEAAEGQKIITTKGETRRLAKDPYFVVDPLETIRVGGFTGIKYSITMFGLLVNSRIKPVREKETIVHFNTPDGLYQIAYRAPVEVYEWEEGWLHVDASRKTPTDMYEKHLPEFEHLLKTFRWTKKAAPAK